VGVFFFVFYFALATSRGARVGILGASRLVGLAQGARDLFGRDRARFLDSVTKEVVSWTTHGGDDVWVYLREIAADQGAMVQLMPEALHLFNAAVTDHQAIRSASPGTAHIQAPSRWWK
jgi:hypothetical protein